MKVVKFGGSSLATGAQLEKVFNIVTSDPERKFVVVSAPGKRHEQDIKVTDLLIECAENRLQGIEIQPVFDAIIHRYKSIAEELSLGDEIIGEIKASLHERLNGDMEDKEHFVDAVKASGEDNNAKLVARYFQSRGVEARYVNPKEAGLFVTDETGSARVLPESYET